MASHHIWNVYSGQSAQIGLPLCGTIQDQVETPLAPCQGDMRRRRMGAALSTARDMQMPPCRHNGGEFPRQGAGFDATRGATRRASAGTDAQQRIAGIGQPQFAARMTLGQNRPPRRQTQGAAREFGQGLRCHCPEGREQERSRVQDLA